MVIGFYFMLMQLPVIVLMKEEVVIIYAFYVDVFFLQNLMMDAIVLSLTAEFRKCGSLKVWFRILSASAAGSFLSVLLLLFGKNYVLFQLLSYVFLLPFMVWISFGWKGAGYFGTNCVISIIFAAFLGGVIEGVEQTFRMQRFGILTCIFAATAASIAMRVFYQSLRRQKNIYSVELRNKGKTVSCTALYDSGNFLKEPFQKRPVQIVSAGILEKLLEGEEQQPQWIPYHSLGNRNGILEIHKIDAMCIRIGSKKIEIAPVLAGKAENGLVENKAYQVILNQNIWETERENYGDRNPKCMEKSASFTEDKSERRRSIIHRRR